MRNTHGGGQMKTFYFRVLHLLIDESRLFSGIAHHKQTVGLPHFFRNKIRLRLASAEERP